MVEKSKKRNARFDNIKFIESNIEKCKVSDKSQDAVFLHFVLHDINIDKRQQTIEALKEKLNADGKLYIKEPTNPNHGMSVEEVRTIMKSSGLREVACKKSKSIQGECYEGIFVLT
ncbi:MAG: methyltransferase domain-containing protein [Bacillota bacterium]